MTNVERHSGKSMPSGAYNQPPDTMHMCININAQSMCETLLTIHWELGTTVCTCIRILPAHKEVEIMSQCNFILVYAWSDHESLGRPV